MTTVSENRMRMLKNTAKDDDETPSWRNEVNVKLRKNKRKETLNIQQKALICSSLDEKETERTFDSTDFKELIIDVAKVDNPAIQLTAVKQCRKLLTCDENHPIDEIIDTGILPILIQCLSRTDNSEVQYESVWALANIASGNSAQINKLVDAGAIPALLQLLKSPLINICELTLWALGNIIDDGPVLRDFVIEQGLVNPLLSFIKPNTVISVPSQVTWVIMNLCRSKDPPLPVKVIQEILPVLNMMIMHNDTEILKDIAWTISYLADSGNDLIQTVIAFGIVPKLIPLLSHKEVEVQTAALTAVSNIVTGTEKQAQVVLNCGALFHFPALLSHQEKEINVLAVRFLNNIFCGNEQQVQAVIDAGLLPNIVEKLDKGELETQRLAAQAVSNLCKKGNKEQVAALLNSDVMPTFCSLLSCPIDVRHEKEISELAVLFLSNKLSENGQLVQAVIDAGLLPNIVEKLASGEPETQRHAVQAVTYLTSKGTREQVAALIDCGIVPTLSNLLDSKNMEADILIRIAYTFGSIIHNIDYRTQVMKEIIESDIVRKLITLLSHEEVEVKAAALCAIGNIAAGTEEQIQVVLDCGALSYIPALLSQEKVICEEAVRFLGNVLSGNEQQVQAVIDAGLLPNFVEELDKGELETQRHVVCTLAKLSFAGTKKQVAALIDCDVIPALCKLLSCEDMKDTDIIESTVKTVYLIINHSVNRTRVIKVIIECGIVPKLITLLSHEEVNVQGSALSAIGNIACGTIDQIQVVLDCGALSRIPALFSHQETEICKQAVRFLANVLSGNEQQVQAVIDAGLLPSIVEKLNKGEFETQRLAAWAVTNFSKRGNKKQVAALIDCDIVPALCKLLSCEDTRVIHWVLDGWRNMLKKAGENVHKLADSIEKCGGVDKIEGQQIHDNVDIYKKAYDILIEFFDGDKTPRRNDQVSEVLTNNKTRRNISIRLPTAEEKTKRALASTDLKALVMNADNPALQLAAVQQCRKLLSLNNNPPTDEILSTGILPILMQSLSGADNPTLQLESAWALTGLAYDTSAQIYKVIYAGAAPVFLRLLESPHEHVCEQALRALSDIISDGPVLRDFVIELGVVKSLLSLIESNKPVQTLRQAARIIRNLCTSKDPVPPVKVIQEILPSLNTLIMHTDADIILHIIYTISYLTDVGSNHMQMVIESGIVPNLIPLLSHEEVEVQRAALSAIGNIVSGSEEHKQVVLNCGALSHFPALLSHQEDEICAKALWFLANVLSGNEQQVQAVIDAGLLPSIVEKLDKSQFQTHQMEAVRALVNLSSAGTKEQVAAFIDCDVTPALCKLLSCEDTQVINNVLESLYSMLMKAGENARQLSDSIAECGGLDNLKQLQSHDNAEIHKKANNILKQYEDFDEMRRRTDKLTNNKREETQHSVSISHCTDEEEIERALVFTDLKELVMYAADADNPAVQLAAVKRCSRLLSCEESTTTDVIIATGILPTLMQCLSGDDNPSLQCETARTLAKITGSNSALISKVVEAGAVPALLQLLNSQHENISKEALIVLANIIDDDTVLRDIVIEHGLVKPLLHLIKTNAPVPILREVLRVIKILCMCKDPPPPVEVIQEILPYLNILITHNDTDLQLDILCAYYILTEAGNDYRQMIIESGIVPNLIPLLSHKNTLVQITALDILGNITTGTEEQIQVVLDCGVLSHFPALLFYWPSFISGKALRFVANVMNGNERQVQAVIDAGLLPSIVENMRKIQFLTHMMEAVRALVNLSSVGTKEQVAALIDCDVIPALCGLLSCEDTKVIHNVLESLYNILEKAGENAEQLADSIAECGGLDKLEELQSHEEVEIYKKAYNILIEYCDGDDEETALMRARLL